MPRTVKKYPKIVSSSVSLEVWVKIESDSKRYNSTPAAVIRAVLEDHYGVPPKISRVELVKTGLIKE